MQAEDKQAAIAELVDVLDENGLISDRDTVLEAVLTREKTRSTGIGSGIAIPHGKCKAVKELVMAVGILAEPVDFESVDGKPVKIILMLVSPLDQTGPHIQALAKISRLMLDQEFKESCEKVESAEQLYELIRKKESQ